MVVALIDTNPSSLTLVLDLCLLDKSLYEILNMTLFVNKDIISFLVNPLARSDAYREINTYRLSDAFA